MKSKTLDILNLLYVWMLITGIIILIFTPFIGTIFLLTHFYDEYIESIIERHVLTILAVITLSSAHITVTILMYNIIRNLS